MADFIAFNEGKNELGSSGLPATCYFLLSTRPCPVDINAPAAGEHAAANTLGGGVGEIATGTGYLRKTQSEPSPTNGAFVFTAMVWSTGANTDWPASVKSILLCTSSDNTGKAIAAWNLQPGGTARDMSAINTTLTETPTLLARSLGET